jgi:hypothetical protein
VKFDLSVDTTNLERSAKAQLAAGMTDGVERSVRNFFDVNPYATVKGDGLKEIEELIANRFLEPQSQQAVAAYFEDNWKRVFEECMTKALQHKANAIVFAKASSALEDVSSFPQSKNVLSF